MAYGSGRSAAVKTNTSHPDTRTPRLAGVMWQRGEGSALADGLQGQAGCLSALAALALSGWRGATAPWDR